MKILLLNTLGENFDTFFTERAMKIMESLGSVVRIDYDGSEQCRETFRKESADADVLFGGWGIPELDEAFYENAKKLKIIAYTGGSVADLVNDSLKKRDVLLLSGNRYYAESVAEATICYMLVGQRRLYPTLKRTETTGWDWHRMENAGLYGKTVGLMSFGMIPKYVAQLLKPFHTRVLVCSSHAISQEELETYGIEQVSAEEMFATCDIVSIHSAMTPKTYHSVNRELLSLMKPDALLVNTARGAVIDEEALAEFLQAGKIHAVLDVFTHEPPAMDSPLRGLDNATLVPHRGGPTTDMREVTTLGLLDDVAAYFRGRRDEMKNVISMDYARHMTSHHAVAEGGKI